jgi:hypothetical protein
VIETKEPQYCHRKGFDKMAAIEIILSIRGHVVEEKRDKNGTGMKLHTSGS